MSKRNKLLVILGVIVLGTVCLTMLLQPNEPKYNGRYLSEWVAMYQPWPFGYNAEEARLAVRAIGTNALPSYVKWIRYEPTRARTALYFKLPSWIKANPLVERWHRGPFLRAQYAVFGIATLGTNAASAIPELTMIMRDGTKKLASGHAIAALGGVGERAIPALKAALTDTNQVNRWHIVQAFEGLVHYGHTNACLPALIESLDDPDANVRRQAINALRRIAPEVLTNAPPL